MPSKLIIIFGPQAVGKMTVGHKLEKITDLKLFHNHMTIDLVNPFFDYSTVTGKKIVNSFRRQIFEEVAKSELEGIIFTFVWAFDEKADWDYVEGISSIFERENGSVYLVELETNLNERIKRNKSLHRLNHKPSKRDIANSEKELLESTNTHRLNSEEGEIKKENYLKINNTNISAEETAMIIKKKFGL